jgi:hypothetical protein
MLRPPVGIALLGFVALMAGVANLLVGLRMTGWVVFGPGDIGSGAFLWGLLAILAGIAFAAAAFALWSTQPWGWLFAHYIAIFGVLEAVIVMLQTGSVTDGLAAAIFPLLVIWYLNDADIRGAFAVQRTV